MGGGGGMVTRCLEIKFYCEVSKHLCGSLCDPWLMMYMYILVTCVLDNVSSCNKKLCVLIFFSLISSTSNFQIHTKNPYGALH